MTETALGLVLGLAITLLTAELIFVYLPYPWDLLGLVVIGGALGYLIPALNNDRTRR
jgi:hypothetical protein